MWSLTMSARQQRWLRLDDDDEGRHCGRRHTCDRDRDEEENGK
jgi:hypothetical protein